jgi:outer membrane protein assembly factor BamB
MARTTQAQHNRTLNMSTGISLGIGLMKRVISVTAAFLICIGSVWTLRPVEPGSKRWEFTASDRVVASPAIAADGTVYVGAFDGSFYALDGATGGKKWETKVGWQIEHSAAVGRDGMIYLVSLDSTSNLRGKVSALDPGTGESKWEWLHYDLIWHPPALGADDTVYVGSVGCKALDKNGMLRWLAPISGDGGFTAVTPDGTVYFGMCALDGQNGAVQWLTRGKAASSPAIGADGSVYIGGTDWKVYALDGATGAVKWEFLTGGPVASSPAIGPDGTVYVGSDDFYIYALDGVSGTKKWEFETLGMVQSSPAIAADGTIYVGSGERGFAGDHRLYALDAATGSLKWSFEASGPVRSSPAIGKDGTVYFGSDGSRVYALHGSAALAVSPWPKYRHDQFNRASVQAAGPPVLLSTVTERWMVEGMRGNLQLRVASSPPLYYQWMVDGQPIQGATNVSLPFERVQFPTDGTLLGNYQLSVSNALGQVVSQSIAVHAGFALDVEITGGVGTIARSIHQTAYAPGSMVELSARLSEGTSIQWEEGLVGTANPVTITMRNHTRVRARFVPPPLVIEAEDFDFDIGRFKREAASPSYAGGAYAGLAPAYGIDFLPTLPVEEAGNTYRPATVSQTPENAKSAPLKLNTGYAHRGERVLSAPNFQLIGAPAAWYTNKYATLYSFRYTRILPPDTYRIYGAISTPAARVKDGLIQFPAGQCTLIEVFHPSQPIIGLNFKQEGTVWGVYRKLGTFYSRDTGGVANSALIPLRDSQDGRPVEVVFSGRTVFVLDLGPECAIDYLVLRPVTSETKRDSFVVELEDWDFDGGTAMPEASQMPYVGGAYSSVPPAIHKVDYNRTYSVPSEAPYRISLPPNAPTAPINKHEIFFDRQEWQVTNSFRIAYARSGNWYNYTRDFPPGWYEVTAALASGGNEGVSGRLSIVTNGVGSTSQQASLLGAFTGGYTGNYDYFQWIPLRRSGESGPALVFLSGKTTLRYELVAGDADFLRFVRVAHRIEPQMLKVDQQPQSQTVLPGQLFTLTAVASAALPLYYQWFWSPNGTDTKPVYGATNATLNRTAPRDASTEAGIAFWLQVSNECGAITSDRAWITVREASDAAPQILQHPKSQTVISGQPFTLTVKATGLSPVFYQWFMSPVGVPPDFAGIALGPPSINENFTTTISGTGAPMAYHVQVSNSLGMVVSDRAHVTVVALPTELETPTILEHPKSVAIARGQRATLTIKAKGAEPIACQWYLGETGDTSKPVAGAVADVFTTPTLTATAAYWVRITNAQGVADSEAAFVDIVEAPQIRLFTGFDGEITIELHAPEGTRWQLEESDDLRSWAGLNEATGVSSAISGTVAIRVPIRDSRALFYRVVWLE